MQLTSRNEAGVKAVLLNGRDSRAPAAEGLDRRHGFCHSTLAKRREVGVYLGLLTAFTLAGLCALKL